MFHIHETFDKLKTLRRKMNVLSHANDKDKAYDFNHGRTPFLKEQFQGHLANSCFKKHVA